MPCPLLGLVATTRDMRRFSPTLELGRLPVFSCGMIETTFSISHFQQQIKKWYDHYCILNTTSVGFVVNLGNMLHEGVLTSFNRR